MRRTYLRFGVATSLAVASLMGFAGVALASSHPPDPTAGQYATGLSSQKSWITDVGVGPLFALAVLVVGISVGLSWLLKSKKVAKQVI